MRHIPAPAAVYYVGRFDGEPAGLDVILLANELEKDRKQTGNATEFMSQITKQTPSTWCWHYPPAFDGFDFVVAHIGYVGWRSASAGPMYM